MVTSPSKEWLKFLNESYRQLIASTPVPFSTLTPAKIPDAEGIYLITAKLNGQESPYYVGRSKNLSRRLYTNHLMGSFSNARLKKYLVASEECPDIASAKKFIRSHCFARWLLESDIRKRGAIEGYVTGLLYPKHGIYEEH